MIGFIGSRFFNAAITLVAAVIATFLMIRVAPGDPVLVLLGDLASPEQIAAARIEYGLDRPIYEQLFIYLGKAFTLDFGNSIIQGRAAVDIVIQRMTATLTLGAVTFALVLALALPLGLLSALYRDRLFDRATSNSSLVVLGIPDFWLGLVFILVFARWLQILPSSGWLSTTSIILPAATLALPLVAVNMRLLRNEAIGVLDSNMVKILRAKGIPTRRIVTHHVLRNALLPVLTVGGVQFGHLLGGAVIVETVFGWPGLGKELIAAISYRDYAVVQACIFVMTFLVVAINLVVDFSYRLIDPRLRRG
ncbi:MAG TPA: ABC transporter permease [Shinella sp.]|jgi:ABC-type dipeptide/oligopeptide/nickel transport system permease component|uniref:ABC transporter permease n=1 Tax=Shinella sp. TaxID=1870904 RepID=UPI002E0D2334|nr:ABC transporter permease [Shinella sp.]